MTRRAEIRQQCAAALERRNGALTQADRDRAAGELASLRDDYLWTFDSDEIAGLQAFRSAAASAGDEAEVARLDRELEWLPAYAGGR